MHNYRYKKENEGAFVDVICSQSIAFPSCQKWLIITVTISKPSVCSVGVCKILGKKFDDKISLGNLRCELDFQADLVYCRIYRALIYESAFKSTCNFIFKSLFYFIKHILQNIVLSVLSNICIIRNELKVRQIQMFPYKTWKTCNGGWGFYSGWAKWCFSNKTKNLSSIKE